MPRQSEFKKNQQLRPTFLREWRKHRGLTQDKLAERIGTTKTRVSMKENGEEPYDQGYLEAAADALQTDVASLLMRDPSRPEAIWSLWDQAKPAQRRTIERLAEALLRTGTE